jgi:hypothetical protein
MKCYCSHIDLIQFENLCPAIGNDIQPKTPANGSKPADVPYMTRGKNVLTDRGRRFCFPQNIAENPAL